MPSSKPSPFSFIDIDELREELNFMVNDIYSKLDYALNLDGKGIIIGLKFGGMGQDITAWDGLIYIAGGASGNLTLGTGLVFDSATGKLYLNVAAKGDLLVGTGDNAVEILPITAIPDGYVLTKGGAGATGLQWTLVTALGAIGTKNPPIDADKVVYRDSTASDALVTSTWAQVKAFLKTYFDTLYVAVTGRYRYAAALADTATITLPTITGNWPAHGFIHCAHASTGVISESAEFEFGSTGTVQIIRGSANIEANGATAGKISLGPVVAANPVVVKNNLGGGVSVNVMITLWYN